MACVIVHTTRTHVKSTIPTWEVEVAVRKASEETVVVHSTRCHDEENAMVGSSIVTEAVVSTLLALGYDVGRITTDSMEERYIPAPDVW